MPTPPTRPPPSTRSSIVSNARSRSSRAAGSTAPSTPRGSRRSRRCPSTSSRMLRGHPLRPGRARVVLWTTMRLTRPRSCTVALTATLDPASRNREQPATSQGGPWAHAAAGRPRRDQGVRGESVADDRQARPRGAGDAIRVLIVDDHALFRRGLEMVLEQEDDVEVVGEAGDGAEAIEKAQELMPDVVLMEVLKLVAKGHNNRDIAKELYISENTVKNHIRNILEKLHLHSRMEAVVYAVREKLLEIK